MSERLELIYEVNSQWASEIAEFVIENPVFSPYLQYSSLTRTPRIPTLITIKDMLKYYVSFAGVRTVYGSQVFKWVQEGLLDKLPTKKRQTIDEINKLPEITTRDEFNNINIKGVGIGAKTFIRHNFFHDNDIIYPTDRIFRKGLAIIYKLNNVSIANSKKIAEQWKGNKSVGSMFCFQVANYT